LDAESKEIISFVAEYPDLLETARKFGVGLDDLGVKAFGQNHMGLKLLKRFEWSIFANK
jgi:hypothetical protein